ncbi:MAG: ATP-binding cassette domain-containing protein [Synergistaceae bacterium]|jgi:energy-coupling factor transport system ATP-binding protein|nr:ATP-binding cassette domain-containing protein [Synergistaceae bacterium]
MRLENRVDEASGERRILSCRNLTFRYEENAPPVFENVSFAVKQGEAVVLAGPSGCGKSTLAYCLAGLYPEYAGALTGDLYIRDMAVSLLSPSLRARRISIMFQNPDNQFCMGRVDHEILFALENISYAGDMRARMRELLRLVGLEDAETAPIHSLSGGTKQKIALATAMATGAEALVLDEPFANVDPISCAELAKKLEIFNKSGLTLFIVDHKLDYWRPFLSRIIIMDRDGHITEADIYPPDLERRKSAFTDRGLFFGDEWLDGRTPLPSPKPEENAVVIKDLAVSYGGKQVFSSLSLEVMKGTITALIGRNGSGKSTLLLAVAGLIRFSGNLSVSSTVGLVFQNPRYQFLSLKVRDEILITLKNAHRSKPAMDDPAGIEALLIEFGLLAYADTSPYMLSQGQQRRLAILSMLAGSRPILLLDEPTYAQDAQATRFIMELLQKRVSQGLTAIIATHDHALARAFANRILSLDDGTLSELK